MHEGPTQFSVLSAITEAARGFQGAQEKGGCLDQGITDVLQGPYITQDASFAPYRNSIGRTEGRKRQYIGSNKWEVQKRNRFQVLLGPGSQTRWPRLPPSPPLTSPLLSGFCQTPPVTPRGREGGHWQPRFNPAQLCDPTGNTFHLAAN